MCHSDMEHTEYTLVSYSKVLLQTPGLLSGCGSRRHSKVYDTARDFLRLTPVSVVCLFFAGCWCVSFLYRPRVFSVFLCVLRVCSLRGDVLS